MTANQDEIWITGVGAITSLGATYRTIADNLLAGHSGIASVQGFDVSQHPSQIAAQVCEVPCPPACQLEDFKNLQRLEQIALWSCSEALADSGWSCHCQEMRVGLVLGVGSEWLSIWEGNFRGGGRRLFSPESRAEPLVNCLQRRLSFEGPAITISAACASANYALSQARHWLESGWADVCLAGGCDAGVAPMVLAGFGNLRALSRRNEAPPAASRPFDRARDGFVLGEGGVMFVLEKASSARERSARVYGQVAGCGATSDAHHMVIPSPDPGPATLAMRRALADARTEPDEIDYINAHATSTPVGDIAEATVIGAVLGDAVERVPVSSTKSMTGHCLTAAAAVEALACLTAIERGAIPPTINLDDPDPLCRLCHVPHEARPHRVRVAVSNSFGFGGSNTSLVLKAV